MAKSTVPELGLKDAIYLTVQVNCCKSGRNGLTDEDIYELLNDRATFKLADVQQMADRMSSMPYTDKPIKKVGNKYHGIYCTAQILPKETAKLI